MRSGQLYRDDNNRDIRHSSSVLVRCSSLWGIARPIHQGAPASRPTDKCHRRRNVNVMSSTLPRGIAYNRSTTLTLNYYSSAAIKRATKYIYIFHIILQNDVMTRPTQWWLILTASYWIKATTRQLNACSSDGSASICYVSLAYSSRCHTISPR